MRYPTGKNTRIKAKMNVRISSVECLISGKYILFLLSGEVMN